MYTLFVTAPIVRAYGAASGVPKVPYPCPAFPALLTTSMPGYFLSREPGTSSALNNKDCMSSPGTDCKIGKVEIPQLFDSISTLGFPSKTQAFFS
ncbi:Uncharacterised protein [uncultured archaeon]|nr:Uncharacterised protein [uncultured archaeon]